MRWACCSFERPRLKTSTSTRLHPVAGNDRPCSPEGMARRPAGAGKGCTAYVPFHSRRSEEHTSELQSLMRISYAVFCLKKKNKNRKNILQQVKNENDVNNTQSQQ